ncbi:hydrolase [Streptomyces sp. HU2014]|uniref:acyl-CoA dehydrogenase family protein n=1 Tax=Streptomyces sp. HU2014 TaxID=2939414 RepID=UPI0020108BF0|nr:acyl-CoA dehydrogenase family protein [Streptomyces sp. HU2014]UQI46582.1 hydrolase [Streptomyces sp. HU2014]
MLDQSPPRIATTAPSATGTEAAPAAAGVAALAAERATAAESARRLDPEVAQALVDAGFPRHFVPLECGGNAGTFRELTPAVAEIGRNCAATAWCASLMANLSRMAAFLPADGFREVWAGGPDTVVVGSLVPAGRARKVPGGWRVSGQWPYISAVDFSDWTLVCADIPGAERPAAKVFAVPRGQFSVTDTWFNIGMRATGSNTVTVEDVLVPDSRCFDRQDLFTGRAVDSTAPCHSVPLEAVNGLSFATPVLGAARGALAAWSAYLTEKIRSAASRPGAPQIDRTSVHAALARCAADIDAAALLLERASLIGDKGAAATRLEVTRNLRDCSYAVDLLVTSVNRLFHAAGTSGQAEASPLQRLWRDVNSAASHIALRFQPAADSYAAQCLEI